MNQKEYNELNIQQNVNELIQTTFDKRVSSVNWGPFKYGRQIYIDIKYDTSLEELRRLEFHDITVQKISNVYDENLIRITARVGENAF